jgi:uncharacterized protein
MIRMKKLFLIVTLLISVCAEAQMKDIIAKPPNPPELVSDYTKTLTPYQEEALEKKLKLYDDSTSNQIAVIIVKSTDNYSIENAAIELGRKWGVGNKDFNNGVVMLIALGDRKSTIQVGYGLEGVIPDLTAKSIIDNEIIPNFKQENYYRGLDEATDAIIRAAEGRYKAPAGYGSRKKKGISLGTIILILIILTLIFGAGGGAAGGGMMSRRGYRGWWGPTMWTGGGGSGWSGGGGSSGGGGFGGFGGGSFGGGGASGSW